LEEKNRENKFRIQKKGFNGRKSRSKAAKRRRKDFEEDSGLDIQNLTIQNHT